jgi:hypothetical protein
MLQHSREPWFPRTISTGATELRQYTVYSIEEAMTFFKASLYEDCYLNMFPNYEAIIKSGALPPTFIPIPNHFMIDLDRRNFVTDQDFSAAVAKTLKNINRYIQGGSGKHPTIIWSGRGMHIHVAMLDFLKPLQHMPEYEEFKDDPDLSNKMLRWAERRLSDGESD